MAIVGLHDSVKVSISASLKSFLLINSRSSGLRVDAGRHLFSEGEKNVALSCSFNFKTLLASLHAASRALALAPLSLRETDPQILKRWGYADEVYLGNKSERRVLVSNFSVTRKSLREFHTSACLCSSGEWTSAASCLEIRNPIAVR